MDIYVLFRILSYFKSLITFNVYVTNVYNKCECFDNNYVFKSKQNYRNEKQKFRCFADCFCPEVTGLTCEMFQRVIHDEQFIRFLNSFIKDKRYDECK